MGDLANGRFAPILFSNSRSGCQSLQRKLPVYVIEKQLLASFIVAQPA
jgi:hypothetical protein